MQKIVQASYQILKIGAFGHLVEVQIIETQTVGVHYYIAKLPVTLQRRASNMLEPDPTRFGILRRHGPVFVSNTGYMCSESQLLPSASKSQNLTTRYLSHLLLISLLLLYNSSRPIRSFI